MDLTHNIVLGFLDNVNSSGRFDHCNLLEFRTEVSETINKVDSRLEDLCWYDLNFKFLSQQQKVLKHLQIFLAIGVFDSECVHQFIIEKLEPLIALLEKANARRFNAKVYQIRNNIVHLPPKSSNQ